MTRGLLSLSQFCVGFFLFFFFLFFFRTLENVSVCQSIASWAQNIHTCRGSLVTVTNTCSGFRYSSTLTDEGVYSLVVQSTEKKGERKSATVRARYALLRLSLVNWVTPKEKRNFSLRGLKT